MPYEKDVVHISLQICLSDIALFRIRRAAATKIVLKISTSHTPWTFLLSLQKNELPSLSVYRNCVSCLSGLSVNPRW